MTEIFWKLLEIDAGTAIRLLFAFIVYLVIGLGPICAALYLVYFLLTLPLRRNERARIFLDMLGLGLKEGQSPEASVIQAASSHDPGLTVRFHLLAAHLETGLRLSQGLERVPRLLPPELNAMLKAGEKIGDVGKVLPVCRRHLTEGLSHVRSAHNYLVLLVFVFTPFIITLPIVFRTKILPSYRAVFEGMMEGSKLPPFTALVFSNNLWLTALQVGIVVLLWILTIAYLGGPRLRAHFHDSVPLLTDRLLLKLPWRRKRAWRDFSAVLAVLLDSGVPEPEALTLAGEATGNTLMQQHAAKARALLGQGIQLPEALWRAHGSAELKWRLGNALRQGGSFVRSLMGWHEALDAQAFQLEQSAAQIATTILVLLNGLIVGSLVIAIFLALIRLINNAVLW